MHCCEITYQIGMPYFRDYETHSHTTYCFTNKDLKCLIFNSMFIKILVVDFQTVRAKRYNLRTKGELNRLMG